MAETLSGLDKGGMSISFHIDDEGIKQLKGIGERLQWLTNQGFAKTIRASLTQTAARIIFDAVVEECVKEIYDRPDPAVSVFRDFTQRLDTTFPSYPRTDALLNAHRKKVFAEEGLALIYIDPEVTVTTELRGKTYTKHVIDYARAVHNGYPQFVFGRPIGRMVPGRPWMQRGYMNAYKKLIASLAVQCRRDIKIAITKGITDTLYGTKDANQTGGFFTGYSVTMPMQRLTPSEIARANLRRGRRTRNG